MSDAHPLHVRIHLGSGAAAVENVRRSRRTVRPSAGVGLANLDERIRLFGG